MYIIGSMNRATAATGMNEGSSRSHSVFTITVNQRNLGNNTTTTGKLVLVDLAGSEMVSILILFSDSFSISIYIL